MKKFFVLSLVLILSMASFTSSASIAEIVAFNTKTHKFHNLKCRYAKICTVNCIKIEKKEAIKRGGKPCKVCGG